MVYSLWRSLLTVSACCLAILSSAASVSAAPTRNAVSADGTTCPPPGLFRAAQAWEAHGWTLTAAGRAIKNGRMPVEMGSVEPGGEMILLGTADHRIHEPKVSEPQARGDRSLQSLSRMLASSYWLFTCNYGIKATVTWR